MRKQPTGCRGHFFTPTATTTFTVVIIIMLSLLRTSFSSALTSSSSSSPAASSASSASSVAAAGEILAKHIVGASTPPRHNHQPQTQTQTLIRLRLATRTDVPSIQRCNLACLPENYNSQFYCSHLRQWPEFALVAEAVETTLPLPLGEGQESRDDYGNGNGQHGNPQQMFRPPKSQSPGGFGYAVGGGGGEPKIVAYVLGKVETRPVIEYDDPFMTGGPSPPPRQSRHRAPYHVHNGGRRHHTGQFETLGHVTSLAVHHDFRRLGLAKALMEQLQTHMQHYRGGSGGHGGHGGQNHGGMHLNGNGGVGGVTSCGLHVRVSNEAAYRLYQNDGYEIESVLPHYYQDGEEAYYMRKMLPRLQQQQQRRSYTAFDNPLFFGNNKKIWRHGPDYLRLPRIHCAIVQEDDEQQQQQQQHQRSPVSSDGNSNNNSEEELLMGSM